MPVIKYKQLINTTLKKPVFGVEDLSKEGMPRNYAKKYLHELCKNKKITRIERGKYTTFDDPIIIASHLIEPCYVSMWTALSIHKLTTQIPFSIEIITTRKRFKRKIMFNNTPIIYYKVQPRMMYGYENIIWKEHTRIPLAKPEKIIIDALYFKTISTDELNDIINVVNKTLLISYAKLTKDTNIIRKVEEMI
jgi:predicted transcriptional regulator of viral defense system